jgi:hypothetical protein
MASCGEDKSIQLILIKCSVNSACCSEILELCKSFIVTLIKTLCLLGSYQTISAFTSVQFKSYKLPILTKIGLRVEEVSRDRDYHR